VKYITREQFNQMFQGKNEIEAEDLVYVLEEKLGYAVSLEKKPRLSDEQRKRMTDWIFSNEDILKQLRESALEPDEDYIDLKDEETLSKIFKEAENDR
jgi:hypothetical protein